MESKLTYEQQQQLLRDHLDVIGNAGAVLAIIKNGTVPANCYMELPEVYRGLCVSYPLNGNITEEYLTNYVQVGGLESFSTEIDRTRKFAANLEGDMLPYIFIIIKMENVRGLSLIELAKYLDIYKEPDYRRMLDNEKEVLVELTKDFRRVDLKLCNINPRSWENYEIVQRQSMPKLNLFGN